MNKKIISWKKYYSYIDELAFKIHNDIAETKINQILCLARGGVIVGDALSRKLNLPLAIMFTSSYNDTIRTTLTIGDDIAKQYNTLNKNILLVDDLLDSGDTLLAVKNHITEKHNAIVKTAIIWKKTTCLFQPDYFVTTMKPTDWIVQPFENVTKINN
jgi:hypoxanthine phosphoribosyltransferase